MASELREARPERYAEVVELLTGVPHDLIPHAEFKRAAREVRAVIRTGDFTPYANTPYGPALRRLREAMLKLDEVMSAARAAKEHGATRFCMCAAWREVKDGRDIPVEELPMQVAARSGPEIGAHRRSLDSPVALDNDQVDSRRVGRGR